MQAIVLFDIFLNKKINFKDNHFYSTMKIEIYADRE